MSMKTVGYIFLVIGIIGLVYGGFSYLTYENVVDVGPIDFNLKTRETLAIPPIVGLLIAGMGILMISRRFS